MRCRSVRLVTGRVSARLAAGALVLGALAACGASEPGATAQVEATAAQPEEDVRPDEVDENVISSPTLATPPADRAVPVQTPTAVPAATEVPVQGSDEQASIGDGLFPTVVDAVASTNDGSSWRFDVTLLSEYDSPQRYADAWRVLDGDDNELGIRVLGHDHANEQPFTRSTSVDIPVELDVVFVEGRDQVNGWSGERFQVVLDR